ncbi:hypothetical protein ASPWEDRAFT_121910 [Aspergillus wentii DTO 134E9]|uniref:Rhodanese domain-containing protein n=1 Tax=Aspergillus wentii DTO 134E9 TaxID=1073089 RepID=A0A1L9R4Z8_ASPWE|nr:uncharacterized protein ASPWEDRAFT_121910 [Aspergillus wentii DTO 134E9]KAI9927232.1 hypothetical protein MW887_003618 [Aspergillus wentii]OJJ29957.1 hypothetical protein ASPWEDRAFT_121910 [Aspergillus wentii DTO 134E9]
MDPFQNTIISPSEYHEAIQNPSARIIPVAAGRAALHTEAFRERHLPGSVFFDMDVISDTTSPYPQMLPSASHFAASIGNLGIHPDDVIVVYDAFHVGIYSAPRVAYTFRLFGHARVHVLNNFRQYAQLGFPIETGDMQPRPKTEYPLHVGDSSRVIAFDELKSLIQNQLEEIQIIDARIPGRFKGVESEAKAGLSSGHMPGAINIPLAAMLDESDAILPTERLREIFERAGVDGRKPTITSCNSGVTAAVLDLVMAEIGMNVPSKRIYDGSWTEWAQRVDEDGLILKD